jgi:hypothetical protein
MQTKLTKLFALEPHRPAMVNACALVEHHLAVLKVHFVASLQ